MLTHKNRMILIFLIFIFRTCQREKCRISRRKHPAIFKVTANGALISRQKFPFVKILFRDLSFGPLIFQQTAKKIIADKIFRAKMWCNAEIFTLSFNLMSYVELLHLRVTQIHVMDGSVLSSVLRLKVNKGQGLRSGILILFNSVLPVLWMWRQELKLFYSVVLNCLICLVWVAGEEKVFLISLSVRQWHRISWNGCHHP